MIRSITFMFMAMLSSVIYAQWSFDVSSVEAYIADHKNHQSLLLTRSMLENGNELLHVYADDAVQDYKDLNFNLDRYTRAFDVIDLLYHSTRTALNARDTYTNVRDNIGKYRKIFTDFHEKCLKRGRIDVSDTLVITINLHCIQKIGNEAENIYRSMTDLVLYATGAAACSTADLMAVLNSINYSLDNIRRHINQAYFDTWRYIQVRIGYWKASVYRRQTMRDIIDNAFDRWRTAGYLKP